MDSRQQYIRELTTAYQVEDEHAGIVPDGGRITVRMTMMDSTQRAAHDHQPAAQPELDPEKAIALRNIQAGQDRVQGFADHYTRQRNLQTLTAQPASNYDQFCYQLGNAWRQS